LDLDETLVHSTMLGAADIDVRVRPGAAQFLRTVTDLFGEVVAFTAGTRAYADPTLSHLAALAWGSDAAAAGRGLFRRRLFREACDVGSDGRVVKDLAKVSPDLSKVVLLDNTPSTYSLQPDNGVPIPSFMGDAADDELMRVLPRLRVLAAAKDVRAANSAYADKKVR
jgi:Dullard-like phosphatase family protein